MKTILVTGANGQLGNELKKLSANHKSYNFVFTDLPEVDLTNADELNIFLKKINPDIIINTAAYTAVDLAESNVETANNVNVNAVANIAKYCSYHNCFLIHFSTDFVFDGLSSIPYIETDSANPTSVYGKTKYDGEKEIFLNTKKAAIIRTSWLYGNYGNNFMKTMLKLGKEKEVVSVVFDQIGTPTWSADLAETVLKLTDKIDNISNVELFHYSNEGVASWYDFTHEIFNLSNTKAKLIPVETKDFMRPAKRPAYSVLNKSKIKNFLNIDIPHWKDSLKKCIENELSNK
ncbi:MAG: dTDP-4-dehydrorhamnose reductase [Bacteroidales bacterium]|jgi:dTDP-4-dehydrorhamnose reductase|nr:dTDP-4-dehydrorhamnose reductase [Bacteroidales bacterium]